jgi:hypothetical protein
LNPVESRLKRWDWETDFGCETRLLRVLGVDIDFASKLGWIWGLCILHPSLSEGVKPVLDDSLAHVCSQLDEGVQIVDRQEGGREHLFGHNEVPQVSTSKIAAGGAGAVWVNGVRISSEGCVLKV